MAEPKTPRSLQCWLSGMLRTSSAASGEEVAALNAVGVYGCTVGSLKHLAQRNFQRKFSRFQLQILCEVGSSVLGDEEEIKAPLDLQLIYRKLLPPEFERDQCFVDSCGRGDVCHVKQSESG